MGWDLQTWKQRGCIDTTFEMTPPRVRWVRIQEAKLPLQLPPPGTQMTEATAFFFPKGKSPGDAKSAARTPPRASDSEFPGREL